jgi:predicted anti-sigma-YlaC factor YlaD
VRCRQWQVDAAAVTRLARVGVAVPAAGVPASVLDAMPGRGRARLVGAMRIALGVLGAGQMLLTVVQTALSGMGGSMVAGRMDGAGAAHLLHESAAWNLAVGAGFILIAWRRHRPGGGVVPILTAFLAALTLMSLDDLISGTVSWSRLASHLLLVAGYVLVVVLSRPGIWPETPPTSGYRPRFGTHRLVGVGDPLPTPTNVSYLPSAQTRHRSAA